MRKTPKVSMTNLENTKDILEVHKNNDHKIRKSKLLEIVEYSLLKTGSSHVYKKPFLCSLEETVYKLDLFECDGRHYSSDLEEDLKKVEEELMRYPSYRKEKEAIEGNRKLDEWM